MRKIEQILFALALVFFGSIASAETQVDEHQTSAEELVLRFWEASITDKALAATLVAEDAQFVVGHVGGDFDVSLMDSITPNFEIDCAHESEQLEEFAGIVQVGLYSECPSELDQNAEPPITFLVDEEKIVGALFFLNSAREMHTEGAGNY